MFLHPDIFSLMLILNFSLFQFDSFTQAFIDHMLGVRQPAGQCVLVENDAEITKSQLSLSKRSTSSLPNSSFMLVIAIPSREPLVSYIRELKEVENIHLGRQSMEAL